LSDRTSRQEVPPDKKCLPSASIGQKRTRGNACPIPRAVRHPAYRHHESTLHSGRQWRDETRALLKGLGEAIDRQFLTWKLTGAERDVGLLILKGLSLKEIAAVRVTSERTIRAQARSIWCSESFAESVPR
jgi:hypothetical protein